MLKITASLPGGVTPESAVSCPGGGGSGGSCEGEAGPKGLLCLHARPQPGPPDTERWVSWPRPALKPASPQPWAFTPHGSIRPPRCPLRPRGADLQQAGLGRAWGALPVTQGPLTSCLGTACPCPRVGGDNRGDAGGDLSAPAVRQAHRFRDSSRFSCKPASSCGPQASAPIV